MLDKQRQHRTVDISCSMVQACHSFLCAEREGTIILPPLS